MECDKHVRAKRRRRRRWKTRFFGCRIFMRNVYTYVAGTIPRETRKYLHVSLIYYTLYDDGARGLVIFARSEVICNSFQQLRL